MNIYFVIDKHNDVTDPKVYDIVIDVLNNPYKERKKDDKLGLIPQTLFAYAPFPLSLPSQPSLLSWMDSHPSPHSLNTSILLSINWKIRTILEKHPSHRICQKE